MAMVLVADDSLSVRKVTERLLTQAGMEVFSVESGAEAMRWMNARRPDLIIADVIMMDMSGYEVCSYIRSHATLRDTPVLLISGVVDEEVMRNADECRANGVIKKPFFGSSLPNRVLELLANAKPPPPASSQDASSTAAKVYRISEGQLQSVRDAMNLIKELEDGLLEERKRAAQLEEQVNVLCVTSGEAGRRISDLEVRLAEAETQSRQVANQASQLENTGEWVKNLEARLVAGEGRAQQLADQLQSFQEAVGRVAELERRLVESEKRARHLEEQAQAFHEKVGDPGARITELESRLGSAEHGSRQLGEVVHAFREKVGDPGGRIGDLEVRLGEAELLSLQLEEQVRGIGDAGERVKNLETRLAEEETRTRQLDERLPSLELALVETLKTLEARVTAEEGRVQRLTDQLPMLQQTVERFPDVEGRLSKEERLAGELREQMQDVRDAGGKAFGRMTELERQLNEEVTRAQKFDEQVRAFGETAEWIKKLDTRLAEEEQKARHLGEQVQAVSEKVGDSGALMAALQARLAEAETRSRQLEEQLQKVRETGGDAAARVQNLETRVEQEEKQFAQAVERIAAVEPAAASMERLVRALSDIARLAIKPGDGIGT